MLEIENKHSIVRDKVESFIIFIRMMVCKIEQISPPHFCKTCLAPQDDFGMQKNLVNKHKQVCLGLIMMMMKVEHDDYDYDEI